MSVFAEDYARMQQENAKLQRENARLVQLAAALAYTAGFESGIRPSDRRSIDCKSDEVEIVIQTGSNQMDELVFHIKDEHMIDKSKLRAMKFFPPWPYETMAKSGDDDNKRMLIKMINDAQDERMTKFIDHTASVAEMKWGNKHRD